MSRVGSEGSGRGSMRCRYRWNDPGPVCWVQSVQLAYSLVVQVRQGTDEEANRGSHGICTG